MMKANSRTFVAEWTAYVCLCGIEYVLTTLILYVCIKAPCPDNLKFFFAFLSFTGGLTVWLARFKIVLTEDHIDYRGGFSRLRRIEFSKVRKWFFGTVTLRNINRELPMLRLVIQTDTETVVINIKPFSRECVQLLNATLTERCGERKKRWGKIDTFSRRVLNQVLSERKAKEKNRS